MAVTQNTYTGNGSTVLYSFTFPYLATTDVKVKLDGVDTTAYTLANATTVQMNSAPSNGAKIIIYRNTDNDNKKATFYPGSSIKAEDLNNNYDQILYTVQEVDNNSMSTLGDTAMQGDMLIGQGFGLQFEGATDDANETRLVAADPTADRTITLPNVTGNVVTTGDTGTVTDAMLSGGTALTSAEKTKLSNIETAATADQTGAEIKAAYEGESDTNAYTDAEKAKLGAIEVSATADMTGSEIKAAYEGESNTNAYTDAEKTKLAGIATGAEVNVQSDWNASSGDAQILNKPTIPTNTNTTYSISCVDGDSTDEEKIQLTAGGDGSGTDDVVLEAGTGLSIARSGDKITFSNSITNNNQLTNGAGFITNNVSGTITATAFSGSGAALTGVTSTPSSSQNIQLNNDVEINLGSGDALKLFHDGTDSFIQNKTGKLVIAANRDSDVGGDIWIDALNGERSIKCVHDSGVELYHDGDKKFETYGNGIIVYGPEGGSGLINLYADEGDDNADKWRLSASAGGSFYLQNYTSGSWETNISTTGNGAAVLHYDGLPKLSTTSTGANITGNLGISGSLNSTGFISESYIKVRDGEYIYVGEGNDLEIFHTSGNSTIKNKTGWFVHAADSYAFKTKDEQDWFMSLSSSKVELYYDGNAKFETTGDGVKTLGKLDIEVAGGGTSEILFSDNVTGRGRIYFDHGSNPEGLKFESATTLAMTINNAGKVGIGIEVPTATLDVIGDIKVTDKVTQTSTAVSALEIDCSAGNYFTKAVTENSAFTYTNVPGTGNAYGFVLELDVDGDRTITWPAEFKWAGGSAATLTASKTHLFSCVTHDGGSTWRCSAAVDFTT